MRLCRRHLQGTLQAAETLFFKRIRRFRFHGKPGNAVPAPSLPTTADDERLNMFGRERNSLRDVGLKFSDLSCWRAALRW
jgi:hypothetical protein